MSEGQIVYGDADRQREGAALREILSKIGETQSSTRSINELLWQLNTEMAKMSVDVKTLTKQVDAVGDLNNRVCILETEFKASKNQDQRDKEDEEQDAERNRWIIGTVVVIIIALLTIAGTHIAWH